MKKTMLTIAAMACVSTASAQNAALPSQDQMTAQAVQMIAASELQIENLNVQAKDRMFDGYFKRAFATVTFSYKSRNYQCGLTAYATVTTIGNCKTQGHKSGARFTFVVDANGGDITQGTAHYDADDKLQLNREGTEGTRTFLDLDGSVLRVEKL